MDTFDRIATALQVGLIAGPILFFVIVEVMS